MIMTQEQITVHAMQREDVPEVRVLFESIPELGFSQGFDTPERLRAYLVRNPGFSIII